MLPGSITLWLAGAAILLPLGTYGTMVVSRNRAVEVERSIQVRQCNQRIETFGAQINTANETNVAVGAAAAANVSPVEKASMMARCQQSGACRKKP